MLRGHCTSVCSGNLTKTIQNITQKNWSIYNKTELQGSKVKCSCNSKNCKSYFNKL
jgi:hypothetical protein